MRYVPSNAPSVSPPDTEGVRQVARVRAVRPVARPMVAPIVATHYRRAGETAIGDRAGEEEVEHRVAAERRGICRRIGKEGDKQVFLDSRAGRERRRNNRRQADIRTNVDEEI